GYLPQHFRFLKDIHSKPPRPGAGRLVRNRIRHRPTRGKVAKRKRWRAAAMLCRSPKENRVTTAADEYYRDIIEGLAIYTRSALQHDVLATITRHPAPDLAGASNNDQIASK